MPRTRVSAATPGLPEGNADDFPVPDGQVEERQRSDADLSSLFARWREAMQGAYDLGDDDAQVFAAFEECNALRAALAAIPATTMRNLAMKVLATVADEDPAKHPWTAATMEELWVLTGFPPINTGEPS